MTVNKDFEKWRSLFLAAMAVILEAHPAALYGFVVSSGEEAEVRSK